MTIDQSTAYRSGGVLEAVEFAFAALTSGPAPLGLDGALLGEEVPSRPIPLSELIGLLYDHADGPAVSPKTRDAIWRALVDKARTGGPAWVTGCCGVALPGLKATASRAARTLDADAADDVTSEIVTVFLEALHTIDVSRSRVGPRLIWRARKAANRACQRHTRFLPTDPAKLPARQGAADGAGLGFSSASRALAQAVELGVLTQSEADLIAVTRLSPTSITELADRLEVPRDRLFKRRQRAEARLRDAILSGHVSAMDHELASNPLG